MTAIARRRPGNASLWVGATVAALAAASFGWLLLRAQALPAGVVAIAWDQEACAHCRMRVSEQGFAAQLQLQDGRVLNFDDPGCLFSYLSVNSAPQHAIYFHHHQDPRWLTRDQVGFVEAKVTPMGFGLAATDGTLPGALGWDQAAARVKDKGAR